MAKPNPSPKMQKKIPIMSKRWPSMPRKVTDERSGSFRLASPLTCSGCARAAEAKTVRNENASATKPIVLGQRGAKLADQMRMVIPPKLELTEYNGSKSESPRQNLRSRHKRGTLPHSEADSTRRSEVPSRRHRTVDAVCL